MSSSQQCKGIISRKAAKKADNFLFRKQLYPQGKFVDSVAFSACMMRDKFDRSIIKGVKTNKDSVTRPEYCN